MKLYILYQDEFAERIAGHLINDVNFCEACGTGCNHCRLTYGNFPGDIIGYEEIVGDFPEIIDDPDPFLPKTMPKVVDLLIPVGLHPDLLSGIPDFAEKHHIPAVLVPVEDKNWVPGGLEKQLSEEFDSRGIQYAFPRPFCSLEVSANDPSKSIIREFIDTYRVGKPIIKLNIKNNKIISGAVIRSQPCGAAYYIIQQLREEDIFDPVNTLDEKISLAHHSFPCSASMETDPLLEEAPLHVGGYIARDAIHDAIEEEIGSVDRNKFHKAISVQTNA
ncbi:MAG: DUF166 domain-containing protein [Promethearchaeota archaeon]